MSESVSVTKFKHKASYLCTTKAALYFSHCNSVVKVHVWTQILSFVSKSRDEFSLEEATFSALLQKITQVRAILVTAVWPELKQEVYEKLGGFFTLKSSSMWKLVCVWGHCEGYLLSAFFLHHGLNYALLLIVWLQTSQMKYVSLRIMHKHYIFVWYESLSTVTITQCEVTLNESLTLSSSCIQAVQWNIWSDRVFWQLCTMSISA